MALLRRIVSLGRRSRIDREIGAELREHIAMSIDDNVSQGMSREQAEREARLRFGNPVVMSERVSAEDAALGLSSLWYELRSAMRVFTRSPRFSLVVVVTLALGIGANTALFELLDAVLLQSLPLKNPKQLAQVRIADMGKARGNFNSDYSAVNNPIWERLRESHPGFTGIAAWHEEGFTRDSGGDAHFASGLYVSGNFFRVLGVVPVAGKVFTAQDDRPGCGLPGAVISYGFWQRQFGGHEGLGQKLMLNDKPVEIVGITPAGFFGVAVGHEFDVAVPICSQPYLETVDRLNSSTQWWLSIIGRLDPEYSVRQVAAQLQAISPAIFASTLRPGYPPESVKDYLAMKLTAEPTPAGVSVLRDMYSDPLLFLLGIAGLVLLITCANLASLMLARTTAREKEMAVRLAMGARKWQLLRLVLGESLLLSLAGSLAGAAFAQALRRGLVAYLGTPVSVAMDWRLFGFLMGISLLTCLLFGLGAALRASSVAPGAAIKRGDPRMTTSRGRLGFRNALVVSQIALSLILLFSALMFTRSLHNLRTDDVGFTTQGVLIVRLDYTRLQLPVERREPFARELLARIRSIAGIDGAANTNIVPLGPSGWGNNVWVDGHDSNSRQESNFSSISPKYFETLHIPMVAGRDLSEGDTNGSQRVAIVNEAFVHKLGLHGNAVGARFWREATPSNPAQLNEIVGLVGDTKYHRIRMPAGPIAYLALSQDPDADSSMQVLVRSKMPMGAQEQAIRVALHEVSAGISFDFQGMQQQIEQSLLADRLLATLSGFFGVLAVVLAITGLYGVMSYTVAERTAEIGIRMALGARRADITAMMLGKAVVLLAEGLVLGAILSLTVASAASALLYGLSPRDPTTLVGAASLLTLVTVAASLIPSMRAANVSPSASLRSD